MLGRRPLLKAACALCALVPRAVRADPVEGPGYRLQFIGSQRETVMQGRREGRLRLETLAGRSGLVGVGPLEHLAGEVTLAPGQVSIARVGPDRRPVVTERLDGSVPFFVWAEVPRWQDQPIEARDHAELERQVGAAGAAAGLGRAFPFLVTGRWRRADLHLLDGRPDSPPGMAGHAAVQVPLHLADRTATLVGFWSADHGGVFTHMGARMHAHLVTPENDLSGHVDALEAEPGRLTLRLPAP